MSAREGRPPPSASWGERATAPGMRPVPPCRSTVTHCGARERQSGGCPSSGTLEPAALSRRAVRARGCQLVHLQPAIRVGVQRYRMGNDRTSDAGRRVEVTATERCGCRRGGGPEQRGAGPRRTRARGEPARGGLWGAGPASPSVPAQLRGRLLATGLVVGRRPGAGSGVPSPGEKEGRPSSSSVIPPRGGSPEEPCAAPSSVALPGTGATSDAAPPPDASPGTSGRASSWVSSFGSAFTSDSTFAYGSAPCGPSRRAPAPSGVRGPAARPS